MFKVLERIFQDKIATEDVKLTGSERFRGKLVLEDAELEKAVAVCPVGAMAKNGEVDYKKCLFCGKCAEAAGVVHSAEDVLPMLAEGGFVKNEIQKKLGRSLHVRHLDAGSCNACDFEMGALSNPYYDLHRYGVHFVASPRHADLLMVTGVVTRNLEEALKKTYEAMPEPRLVMACGACAASGGTYGESYAIVGAADKVVPVDIYLPGCPPRPAAMLAGLLAAADLLKKKM